MSAPILFDRRRIRLQRGRCAKRSRRPDVLRGEIVERLVERFADVSRDLPVVLDLGARRGEVGAALAAAGRSPSLLVEMDLVTPVASAAGAGLRLVGDEEVLPFGAGTLDAALSVMSLHTVNDLPGALSQIHFALKPGGLLLVALPGGQTLHELRYALTQAEIEVRGGAAGRVAPAIDVRDLGALLQRAGFELPMADLDRITFTYAHPFRLIDDLRAMAETGVLAHESGSRGLDRRVAMRMAEIYATTFRRDGDRVPATFDILFATGWKAAEPPPQAGG